MHPLNAPGVLTVRPATEADVPRLVEVARRAWLSAFAQHAHFAILQEWFRLDREPGWYASHWPAMTVAELDGLVQGLVQPAEDEVNGLWVHPEVHGLGLGSRLLAAAEEQIRRGGHRRAWLTCSCYNPGARGFYAARGYRELRRHTEQFGSVQEEVLVLGRELTPPAE